MYIIYIYIVRKNYIKIGDMFMSSQKISATIICSKYAITSIHYPSFISPDINIAKLKPL